MDPRLRGGDDPADALSPAGDATEPNSRRRASRTRLHRESNMRRVVLLLLLPLGAALANGAGVTGASGASGPYPCAGCHSGGTFGAALSLSSVPTTVAPLSANDFELLLSN